MIDISIVNKKLKLLNSTIVWVTQSHSPSPLKSFLKETSSMITTNKNLWNGQLEIGWNT